MKGCFVFHVGNGIGSVVTFSKPQIAFFKKPVIVFQHKKRVEVVLNYLCENYDPRWKIHIITHHYICSQKKERSGYVRHLARKRNWGIHHCCFFSFSFMIYPLISSTFFLHFLLDWFFSLCYFMESNAKNLLPLSEPLLLIYISKTEYEWTLI